MGYVRVNQADIMQAVETQLINFGIVPTADPIYWLRTTEKPKGRPTGKRDILLVVPTQLVDKPAQIGGGRLALRMEMLIEVHLRTIMLLDRVNTDKDAIIDHSATKTSIIDALESFRPMDALGNDMTIYGLRKDSSITPEPDRLTPEWGESVGTWRLHFLPRISQTPQG